MVFLGGIVIFTEEGRPCILILRLMFLSASNRTCGLNMNIGFLKERESVNVDDLETLRAKL